MRMQRQRQQQQRLRLRPLVVALLLLLALGTLPTAAAFLARPTKPALTQHQRRISQATTTTATTTARTPLSLLPVLYAASDGYDDGYDDDLTERSLSLLGKLAKGLNRELPVPAFLVPPRASDAGRTGSMTTIKGWFPLSMGLSLTLGNPVYPAAFVGFLYLSRPTDAPDVAAALAAAVVAGVVNPLVESFADATGLDDSFLGRVPFLLGAAATAYVLVQVLGEGKEVFVDAPRREERERMPAAKAERDLRFFDVKAKQTTTNREPPSKAGGDDE